MRNTMWRILAVGVLSVCVSAPPALAGPALWNRIQNTVAQNPAECGSLARKAMAEARLSLKESSTSDHVFGGNAASTVAITCIATANRGVAAVIMVASTSDEGKQLFDRLTDRMRTESSSRGRDTSGTFRGDQVQNPVRR
jgi:hypothetical protein